MVLNMQLCWQGDDGDVGDPGPVGQHGVIVSRTASISPSIFFWSSFPVFSLLALICVTVRVLKGMSVRRGTLAFLELLDLLDLEGYRERMDLKAPL